MKDKAGGRTVRGTAIHAGWRAVSIVCIGRFGSSARLDLVSSRRHTTLRLWLSGEERGLGKADGRVSGPPPFLLSIISLYRLLASSPISRCISFASSAHDISCVRRSMRNLDLGTTSCQKHCSSASDQTRPPISRRCHLWERQKGFRSSTRSQWESCNWKQAFLRTNKRSVDRMILKRCE